VVHVGNLTAGVEYLRGEDFQFFSFALDRDGFRAAEAFGDGKPPAEVEIDAFALELASNELRGVRFFVRQSTTGQLVRCRRIQGSVDLSPRKGQRYGFEERIGVSTRAGARRTSPDVVFDPDAGRVLTVLAPGMSLRVRGVPADRPFRLCSVA
jgi:hypothetical protein